MLATRPCTNADSSSIAMTTREREDPLSPQATTTSVLVVGVSVGPVCGVRDHTRLLSAAMRGSGLTVTTVWLDGSPDSPDLTRLDIPRS